MRVRGWVEKMDKEKWEEEVSDKKKGGEERETGRMVMSRVWWRKWKRWEKRLEEKQTMNEGEHNQMIWKNRKMMMKSYKENGKENRNSKF